VLLELLVHSLNELKSIEPLFSINIISKDTNGKIFCELISFDTFNNTLFHELTPSMKIFVVI